MWLEMWKRIIVAGKVLVGVRPAETRFDELDERIAECYASGAADKITGRYLAPEDDPDEDETCRQITEIITEAIKLYASNGLTKRCREQLRQEAVHKRERALATKQGSSEIPF
jgi:hypothetical protein